MIATRRGIRGRDLTTRWAQIKDKPSFLAEMSYAPLRFTVDLSSTADADPGDGFLTFNHATQSNATMLFVDFKEVGGNSVQNFLSGLPPGGYLYLQQATNPNIWQIWKWTAVTPAAGYCKFAVEYQAGAGSFDDDRAVYVEVKPGGGGGGGGGGLQGFAWLSDTATQSDSDPGAGNFRWNHATQSSATKLYLDVETKDLRDVQTHFANLFGMNPVGFIHVQQADDVTRWQRWKWTGIENGVGYFKLTVSLEAWSNVAIQDDKTVLFDFIPSGNGVLLYFPDAPPVVSDADSDEFNDGSVSGSWTTVNQSGLTLIATEGDHGLRLENQNWLSNYFPVGLARDIGGNSTAYTTKVSVTGYHASSDYNLGAGIMIWEDRTNSSGDVLLFGLVTSPGGHYLALYSWSAWNGSITITKETQLLYRGTHVYLRVRKIIGTSYKFDYSTDGIGWIRFYALTTGYTPAHIGPGMYLHGIDPEGDGNGFVHFRFWRKVSDVNLRATLLGRKLYI